MYGKRAQKRADSLSFGLPFVAGILNDIHSIGKDSLVHIVHALCQAVNALIGSKQTIISRNNSKSFLLSAILDLLYRASVSYYL